MKKIIFTTIALLYVTACFPSEKQDFVITSEKFTTTFKSGGIEHSFHKKDNPNKTNNPDYPIYVTTFTNAPDKTGKVNMNTEVDSYHDIYITNPYDIPLDYEIKLALQADQALQGEDYHVTVNAHGNYEDHIKMFADAQIHVVSVYGIAADSYVVNQTGDSHGYGKLTITE